MIDRYDAIVVGGHAAGASTALLLARAGARVLVLDRERAGSEAISTHALMRTGVLQLARWGLLDRIRDCGTPAVRESTFCYPGAEPVRVVIRPTGPVDALYAPRRSLLDGVLIDAAEQAGAEVRRGIAVCAVTRGEDGAVGGVETAGGEKHAARWVIGADGFRSTVANAVEAPITAAATFGSAVRYTYVRGLDDRGYEWNFGNGAASGAIPTNHAEHCLFVATTPKRMRALRRAHTPDETFTELLSRSAPAAAQRLIAAERVAGYVGWGGLPGFLRRAWGPGWALVGDAGYFKDPLTSHGISDALRDSELLARAVIDTLEGAPAAVALGRYEEQRDRISMALLHVGSAIASLSWRNDEIGPLLRQLNAAMVDELAVLGALQEWPARFAVVGGAQAKVARLWAVPC